MINRDLKKFKDLTRTEKMALFEFWLDNGYIYFKDIGKYSKLANPSWMDGFIYTTEKPVELKDGCWYKCEDFMANEYVLYHKAGYMHSLKKSANQNLTLEGMEISLYKNFRPMMEIE